MTFKDKIIAAKNKFGEQAIDVIVKDLKIDYDEQNYQACCPFHKEDTASFKWHKKDNHFKCFGCGVYYSIIDHYIQFYNMTSKQAVSKLLKEAQIDNDDEYKEFNVDYFKNYKYPAEEENLKLDIVEEYCKKRHISLDTLVRAGIKQDDKGNMVFEYRDIDNVLLACKYRPSRAIRRGESKMWFQKDASNCPSLFNKQNIDITQPLVITEGEVDTLAVIESGYYNVVSIPYGSNDLQWLEFNFEWLENFDKIILFVDDDKPGRKMLEEVVPRLGVYRCSIVEIPDDIKKKLRESYANKQINSDKADANSVLVACGKLDVLWLIENAREVEDSEIKDLMSFKYYSIQDRERFPTGIKAFDKVMYGHLLKCLTLYTGYTGAGKTTTVNQIALKPFLESKEQVFVFSGEMGGDKLMSWLLDSMAGFNHTIEFDNGDNAPKGYAISKQSIEVMQKYYTDNIKYYNKRGVATPKGLFEKMEYCRRKYGTKHFFIDNLMCLMVKGNDEDKWNSQIEFIVELSEFAESKNVNVSMVAHPKKPNGNSIQSIYDISGVSELANICNRAFWVKKVTDPEKDHQSEIIVLKDRETQVSEGTIIQLKYDKRIKRLYTDDEELYRQYSWEKNIKIKYPEHIENKLVANIKRIPHPIFG